jgi:ABC-2 type transport system permease protein
MAGATSLDSHSASDESPRVVSARIKLRPRLRTLWQRRELLRNLISSDIRIQYKGSVLGIVWSMLSPAFSLGIFYLVFSVFLKNGIPDFAIYLFAGLVVWNMFSNGVTAATNVIVDRAGLVKKVSFPREILPLATVGSAVVYFLIQIGVLLGLLAIMRHAPDWKFFLVLPVSFGVLYFFTAAVGILLSAFTVYLRDLKHLITVALQLWFYLTPVVYSYENTLATSLHANGLASLYVGDPVTLVVLTFQRTFYATVAVASGGPVPFKILPTWSLATFFERNLLGLGVSVVLFLLALMVFGRLEGNFESEL